MSSKKRAVSVLFDEAEYAALVKIAAELTLREGRRVSIAELTRRAALAKYGKRMEAEAAT